MKIYSNRFISVDFPFLCIAESQDWKGHRWQLPVMIILNFTPLQKRAVYELWIAWLFVSLSLPFIFLVHVVRLAFTVIWRHEKEKARRAQTTRGAGVFEGFTGWGLKNHCQISLLSFSQTHASSRDGRLPSRDAPSIADIHLSAHRGRCIYLQHSALKLRFLLLLHSEHLLRIALRTRSELSSLMQMDDILKDRTLTRPYIKWDLKNLNLGLMECNHLPVTSFHVVSIPS